MNKMKEIKKSYHIPFLVVLGLIFIVLLVISTAQIGVKYEYIYYENVVSNVNSQTKIGEINVENDGFLPTKIQLKRLYGCVLNENSQYRELYVSYSKPNMAYSTYENSIEVSSNSKVSYDIRLEYYPIIPKLENINLTGDNNNEFEIAIFESSDNNYYGSCVDSDISKALKIINIKDTINKS